MTTPEPLLTIRQLRVGFPRRRGIDLVVNGVDLDLYAGRITCLIGESGSGKSMTALAALRILTPPGRTLPGSAITFTGQDVLAMSRRRIRQLRGGQIAMIFQEPATSLNPAYTCGAQIAESIRLHEKIGRRAAFEKAVELLGRVGIPEPRRRAADYPHHLSGGMQQRVMIAMALSSNPQLLIADEPTTALDVTIQAQILGLLLNLRDEFGLGVLFITHDVGIVAQIADEVALMYNGRIVLRGPAASCLDRPRHPYLKALLTAVPDLESRAERRLPIIAGAAPRPGEITAGCAFAPRCPLVIDRCTADEPPLEPVGDQLCACWRADELAASR